MRIALLADIHGNPLALEAALADIELQGGADEIWVLGDMVAIGPDPVGVLERLSRLPHARFIAGNTERYVTRDAAPKATTDPSNFSTAVEVSASFAWTQGVVTRAGWLDWLIGLPAELRTVLPDGTRLLGVHASPGREDGTGFLPGMSEAEMRALLAGCEADLVCVGHTHCQMDVQVDGVRVVNPGCVSNAFLPGLRTGYAIVEANAAGYTVEHRTTDFDHEAIIAEVQRLRHPGAPYITRIIRGQFRPG